MITRIPRTIASPVRDHYFTEGATYKESPVTTAGLIGVFLGAALAFFTMAFDTIAGLLFFGGFAWFAACFVLHVVLWILGNFYRHGILSSLAKGAFFTVVVVAGLAVIAVFLFGWVVPVMLFGTVYGVFVPEPFQSILLPFAMILMLGTAFAWYSKGLNYIDHNM